MSWISAKLVGCGFLLGTAGVRILSSRDAKNLYTHVTAAVLRGADDVIQTAVTIKENCQDIYEDAKAINEIRRAEDDLAFIEDIEEEEEEKETKTSGRKSEA